MTYSQNNEEDVILGYFYGKSGRFLDIGAFDGIRMSNTRALVDRGWGGVYVECSPKVLPALYANCPPDCKVEAVGLGSANSEDDFYDNENGYATLVAARSEEWKGLQHFYAIKIQVEDWATFYSTRTPGQQFDCISIDIEGMNRLLLKQMDLVALGCRLLVVEYEPNLVDDYIAIAQNSGMILIYRNQENLIFAR